MGQTATGEGVIYTAEAHLNLTGDTTTTRQQSGSVVFRSGGPLCGIISPSKYHIEQSSLMKSRRSMCTKTDLYRVIFCINPASGTSYFCYFLTGWQLSPYAEILVHTHQFFFYESHGDSGNINQRKDLSVLKNRNAKQSFTESAYKSSHNQNHTHSISPLLLYWRLHANWLEYSEHNLTF